MGIVIDTSHEDTHGMKENMRRHRFLIVVFSCLLHSFIYAPFMVIFPITFSLQPILFLLPAADCMASVFVRYPIIA